jgi:hypothetical protein
LLRNVNDSSLWIYCYRILLSPNQVRNHGFLGIGSDSDDWYNHFAKTTIKFRSTDYTILDFAPQNEPPKSTTTIGVGANVGTDGVGFSCSASVSYDHSDLTVNSYTNTGNRIYSTEYYYDSNAYNTNTYLANDVYAYGMVSFKKSGVVWLDISHEIGYYGFWYYGYFSSSSACNVKFSYTY